MTVTKKVFLKIHTQMYYLINKKKVHVIFEDFGYLIMKNENAINKQTIEIYF
jgi:hypothetical protein